MKSRDTQANLYTKHMEGYVNLAPQNLIGGYSVEYSFL